PLTKVPVTLPTVQPFGRAFVNSYGNVNGVGVQERLLAAFTSSAWSVAVCCASGGQVTMLLVTGVGVAVPVAVPVEVGLDLGMLIVQLRPQPACDCALVSPPGGVGAPAAFRVPPFRPVGEPLGGTAVDVRRAPDDCQLRRAARSRTDP